jgi:hypothetical protein
MLTEMNSGIIYGQAGFAAEKCSTEDGYVMSSECGVVLSQV